MKGLGGSSSPMAGWGLVVFRGVVGSVADRRLRLSSSWLGCPLPRIADLGRGGPHHRKRGA
ncbi:hypothetical protein TIFTF001_023773 [Ficus carica]|uniref:Uncharacterized protein n=1 Tax=Ficus carica TaxID=3494 RepID=A0AA88DCS2_FICCA|nr:hypothetical protein TIFTF001_023773 [Ficus carica]